MTKKNKPGYKLQIGKHTLKAEKRAGKKKENCYFGRLFRFFLRANSSASLSIKLDK
jgi:hypothetical protein